MYCRICNIRKLKKIIKIGSTYRSIFIKLKKKFKKFSLDLFECQNCKLVQFSKVFLLNKCMV